MKVLMFALLAVLYVLPSMAEEEKAPAGRVAVVLLAGNETNEGMARAVHALLYARELDDAGFEVVLIYDGAGTGWANEMNKPEHPLYKHYAEFKKRGMVEEICDYCAEQFGNKESLPETQRKLLVGDYEGHPDIAKWVSRGFQVIVL